MNFNSVEFFLFFSVLLVLYAAVFHRALLRDPLLLVSSYFFYMCWNWKYAGLLALSTCVDYSVGRLLDRTTDPGSRRLILIISLTSNLGLLALFKYYNFFMDMAKPAASAFGWDISFLQHQLLLPVGISFYTFQTMSYTIDVYRGERVLERNFLKFAVFVAFFPQLIAGRSYVPANSCPSCTTRQPSLSIDFTAGCSLSSKVCSRKLCSLTCWRHSLSIRCLPIRAAFLPGIC